MQSVPSVNHLQCGCDVRTELVLWLPAGIACCLRGFYILLAFTWSFTALVLSHLELITEFLHVSIPLCLKKITFSKMSQISGKQRRKEHIMFCFWSATAGSFCLYSAQDAEPSGKAGIESPLNPLSTTHNSGGLAV